jgi:hypothetical protein
VEARDILRLRVIGLRERDAKRQHAIWAKARIDGAQLLEAPQHESRAHEQNRRHRDLRDNEQLAEAAAVTIGCRGAIAAAQHRRRCHGAISSNRDERRTPRRRRRRMSVVTAITTASSRISPERGSKRWRDARQYADRAPREEHTDGASREQQHRALRKRLRKQVSALRTQRDPKRDLSTARFGADEQQTRDVDAGDEQDERPSSPRGVQSTGRTRPTTSSR